MKKMIMIILLFISMILFCNAPEWKSLFIIVIDEPNQPFEPLIEAVTWVESKHGLYVWNSLEEATGHFQIRPIRLEDYNKKTGNSYVLEDMYDYEISKKIFLYYAIKIGPYDFERIAKNWNGSGPKTIEYWDKVKRYLNLNLWKK